MKKVIRATTDNNVIFEDPYFALRKRSGIGVNNTPYEQLEVISKSTPAKYVVEIRLDAYYSDFNGEPVKYQYRNSPATVAHGMAMRTETLEDTIEYIDVLEDAVAFARKVNSWINANPDY